MTRSHPSESAERMLWDAEGWRKASSSLATAGGMCTTAYRRARKSSRPITARLQIGEVLLTASMGEVLLRLGDAVLAGDSALRKSDTESMLVESRQASTLSQRQPAVPVEPACQFDLHRPLTLSRTQRQAVQGLLIQFKGNAHVSKLATAHLPDKAGPGLDSTPGATAAALDAHECQEWLLRRPATGEAPGPNHPVRSPNVVEFSLDRRVNLRTRHGSESCLQGEGLSIGQAIATKV